MLRAIKFALISLALHAIALTIMRPGEMLGSVALGSSVDVAPSVMTVEIRSSKEPAEASAAMRVSDSFYDPRTKAHSKKMPAVSSEATAMADRTEKTDAAPTSTNQDFVTVDSLTRMPVPVTNIDLDVAEIRDLAAASAVSLAILIDADGSVIDVINMHTEPSSKLFAEKVAEVFRRARFVPGEINGKAVKARLEINVVSENLVTL